MSETRGARAGVKRWLPAAIVGLFALMLLAALRAPRYRSDLNIGSFAKLPVLNGGRIKPLDTVARTSLLMLRGKQTVRYNGESRPAIRWLLDVLFQPAAADKAPVFDIDDPDVLGLMGIQQTRNRYYSFADLQPKLQQIEQQAAQADQTRPEHRTRYQGALLTLHSRLMLYQKLQNSLQLSGTDKVADEYLHFTEKLAPLMVSHATLNQKPTSELKDLAMSVEKYRFLSEVAEFFPLAGARGTSKDGWVSVGQGLLDTMTNVKAHPGVMSFAIMADAYRAGDATRFNEAVHQYRDYLVSIAPKDVRLSQAEYLFNYFEPFYQSMILYTVAFLIACLSWLWWPRPLNRSAYALVILGFVVHTAGLVARMVLQGRPPVTNLYSSAIFVGWVAVLLGIVLERFYRNGIGSAMSAMIGFMTLIIAHHLTTQGDTLEMMRAVLDSNFWLATHVITITIGYSSTFLSGAIGILYILRRTFDKTWSDETAATLERMVYGIVCFSTFFSFIGTVLGGIWADQSWGRFWGWDPKENGALMIVLWNAFILHARLGGLTKPQSVMAMAIFGNVVTAFSWFGVNMLGIGLHSYGFMDKAFVWLLIFSISQFLVIGLGLLPDYMTARHAARQR